MKKNITQFGDCFFKQLCGTAIGTSVAVMYDKLAFTTVAMRKLDSYLAIRKRFKTLHDLSTIFLSYGSAA